MADSFKELVQIVFEQLGAEEADKFATTLRAIGDAGVDVDEKLSPLLDQLRELSATSAKVGEALDISDKITANNAALTDAREKLAALNAEFNKGDKSSEVITTAFAQAEKQVKSLAAEQFKLQAASKAVNDELKASGVDTSNLGKANDDLKQKTAGLAQQITTAAKGLKDSAGSAHDAAAGFAEVAEKSTLLRKVVDVIKELAAAAAGLFVLDKAKEAIGEVLAEGDKAAKFQQQFADAFGGVEKGAEAFTRVKELAETLPLSLDDVQAAAIRAKKQGLDPLSGSLEGLVTANARYGGDINTLNGLIDEFGKATAKGAVSSKLLVSLQQQGIPAAKLLGDAMGKSADEILRLADAGSLGGQSVKTLLGAISESGAQGAGQQLGFLSTLTTKLKDEWSDFLGLIAESGAYDFVKAKLAGLNTLIHQGLADGSLAKAAKGISDAIVAIGSALAAAGKFAFDHAAAIASVVKGYVLFRTVLLSLNLTAAAANMLSLATATKEAGAAADAAASPTGAFGKLRGAINKIPGLVQVAVVIPALAFTIDQLQQLNEVLNAQIETWMRGRDIENDIADQREKNAAKAAQIAQQLKGFADVQVQSSEQVKAQSEEQAKAYIDQLQNATRYYNALRIQAQQSGDTDVADEATEKLRRLGVALVEAKKHFDDLGASNADAAKDVGRIVDQYLRLRLEGVSTAAALEGAFNKIELRTPEGIDETVQLLRTIAPAAGEARNAIQGQLITALEKLNAADLAKFEAEVTRRLGDAKGKSEELAVALDGAVTVALKRLGLTAEQAGQKVTEGGQEMIATFDTVAAQAGIAGDKIQLAFAAALSKASTSGEVEQLQSRLQGLFDKGAISAAQFGVASEAAGRKLVGIKVDAATTSAALDGVGASGESAAARLVNSLEAQRQALATQETELSAEVVAAFEAGDQDLVDSLNAKAKLVSQQIAGLNDEIDKVGTKQFPAPNVQPVAEGFQKVIDTSTTASRAIEQSAAKAKEAGGTITTALGPALGQLSANMSELGATSEAAALRYNELVEALFKGAGVFSAQATADGTGIIRYGEAVQQAFKLAKEEIEQQKESVASLGQYYTSLTDSQLEDMGRQRGGLQQVAASLAAQAAAARAGAGDFGLLGESDLGPLIQGLEQAAQRAAALAQQAIQTKSELADLANSFQDQIDQIQGKQKEAEDRNFQITLENLRQKAEAGNALDSAEYQQAVANATKLHQLKLQQIAEQDAAKKKSDADAAARQTAADKPSSSSSSSQAQSPAASQQEPPAQTPTSSKHEVSLTINGNDLGTFDVKGLTQGQLSALAQKLAPELTQMILRILQQAAATSGGRR